MLIKIFSFILYNFFLSFWQKMDTTTIKRFFFGVEWSNFLNFRTSSKLWKYVSSRASIRTSENYMEQCLENTRDVVKLSSSSSVCFIDIATWSWACRKDTLRCLLVIGNHFWSFLIMFASIYNIYNCSICI